MGRVLVSASSLVLLLAGCGSPPPPQVIEEPEPPAGGDPLAPPSAEGRWTAATQSPQLAQVSPEDHQLLSGCSAVDAGLNRVAGRLAKHQANTLEMLSNDELSFEMRAAGVPHVWPRAWSMIGDASTEEAAAGLADWNASFGDGGQRRCGIGHAPSAMGAVVAVVALDAIADLQPLPRTARVGQWLEVRADLIEPASAVEVVVLGPRGAPRSVPSTLHEGEVRARVPVDQPGPWLVQVLPTLASGPRPALEAMIFVDEAPPVAFQESVVPGETASVGAGEASDDGVGLLNMLNQARAEEGLTALRHNPNLDVAAQIHVRAMRETGRVAHDVGSGGPEARIAALGISPSIAGENVARAQSPRHAHRALWGSPSHRGNMLHSRFTDVGIGVERSEDGSVWVCEVFAAF